MLLSNAQVIPKFISYKDLENHFIRITSFIVMFSSFVKSSPRPSVIINFKLISSCTSFIGDGLDFTNYVTDMKFKHCKLSNLANRIQCQ